jgi:hypothetical protein
MSAQAALHLEKARRMLAQAQGLDPERSAEAVVHLSY